MHQVHARLVGPELSQLQQRTQLEPSRVTGVVALETSTQSTQLFVYFVKDQTKLKTWMKDLLKVKQIYN